MSNIVTEVNMLITDFIPPLLGEGNDKSVRYFNQKKLESYNLSLIAHQEEIHNFSTPKIQWCSLNSEEQNALYNLQSHFEDIQKEIERIEKLINK